jgi:hypothetical protein
LYLVFRGTPEICSADHLKGVPNLSTRYILNLILSYDTMERVPV